MLNSDLNAISIFALACINYLIAVFDMMTASYLKKTRIIVIQTYIMEMLQLTKQWIGEKKIDGCTGTHINQAVYCFEPAAVCNSLLFCAR